MKRTILAATLIVMSASPAMAAQQWKHLGSDGAKNHYYYNPRTFKASKKDIVGAWVRKEYNVDPDVMAREKLTPEMYKGSRTVTALEQFNCGKKKMRIMVGKEIEGFDDKDLEETGWLKVAPGSLDESLMNALCREGKK